MSKNVRKEQKFEQLFPIQKGRRAIDDTIDAYDGDSLEECLELCEQAYFDTTGTSPVRA